MGLGSLTIVAGTTMQLNAMFPPRDIGNGITRAGELVRYGRRRRRLQNCIECPLHRRASRCKLARLVVLSTSITDPANVLIAPQHHTGLIRGGSHQQRPLSVGKSSDDPRNATSIPTVYYLSDFTPFAAILHMRL